jgi:hypothetical protein
MLRIFRSTWFNVRERPLSLFQLCSPMACQGTGNVHTAVGLCIFVSGSAVSSESAVRIALLVAACTFLFVLSSAVRSFILRIELAAWGILDVVLGGVKLGRSSLMYSLQVEVLAHAASGSGEGVERLSPRSTSRYRRPQTLIQLGFQLPVVSTTLRGPFLEVVSCIPLPIPVWMPIVVIRGIGIQRTRVG